jgi:hypothetical protein
MATSVEADEPAVTLRGKAVAARVEREGGLVVLRFSRPVTLRAGDCLTVA